MKKSRRTYNGVHLNKKSNTQDVVEQSLTIELYSFEDIYELASNRNNVFFKLLKKEFDIE